MKLFQEFKILNKNTKVNFLKIALHSNKMNKILEN